jgi:hypothetical protein
VDNNPALSNNDEIPRMGGKLVPPFTFDLPFTKRFLVEALNRN